ncbi:juvenile hormone epoxide hydrolase isoform X2 [Aethina tumida]|uniref:juvenile hormone epoxide hydrolase isoform X2 n=1 Tax=Aethina tumida TaxID=116153 RepID=UPI0021477614|nr:juvenile hormone epoxide hydrolase isoform X2 [Aethina tumida]
MKIQNLFCLFFYSLAVGIFAIFYGISHMIKPGPIPVLENTYWGPGIFTEDDPTIKPFRIKLEESVLNDLHLRLNITRLIATPLENSQTRYGYTGKALEDSLKFLRYEYNFQQQLDFLNSLPQFTTQIQGLQIHFVHVKPEITNVKVLPILLLHGWPSSVRSFYKMARRLSVLEEGRDFVFEVVVPSLPGFGYSDAPAKKDCQTPEVAVIFKNLMERLGHEEFYVHGEDWGAIVATNMATLFPDRILGHHSNFCLSLLYKSLLKITVGMVFPSLVFPNQFQYKWYPPQVSIRWIFGESGYLHLQGTKPDTVGVSLDNSIEGLVAFMFEKMAVGTNKDAVEFDDGGLHRRFNYTSLFDNLFFYYWLPKKATTAARFYAENLNVNAFARGVHNIPIDPNVPCGCTFFEHEFLYFPEEILKDKYTNLIHFTTYRDGGHFVALEFPDKITNDLITFIKRTLHKEKEL